MRSTRLAATLAIAALLASATAVASAAAIHPLVTHHAHISPLGCRVSALAEPRRVTSGESVQVFGALSCPGGALAGQPVTVYERSVGVPTFAVIATTTTAAGGSYAIASPPITADSVFYVTVPGAVSAHRTVKVAPTATLGGPADGSQLYTGVRNRVTFRGSVSPLDAGAVVVLQRENATSNEEWRTISVRDVGVVQPDGSFTITHTFALPGDANLRAVVRPHGKFDVRGVSNTLSYEISQAENPRLTIHSAADPVAYGQPITITGVLAGGANQHVTLLTHHHGVLPFAAIQQAGTDAGGAYKFVIPAATANASYRVSGGGVNSAVLFEGVKYLVTAAASATQAPAGTAVTFSGTVVPGNVGKVVYLEREDAFNPGFFHVADVGFVAADATYSITHFVFGSGKQVYRIKVPGDPIDQGVASATLPLEVTPPAPGSLKPVPLAREPR